MQELRSVVAMRTIKVLCCAWLCCTGGAALAVSPGTVSATAQGTCEYRAVASRHPDPRLRNPDTLAAKLCEPRILPGDYPLARFRIERNPEQYAAFFFVNARTHYIDAQVRRAAKEGVSQVVVLGAGFDSRAYRFRKALPKLQFFEVDHPATSAAKQQAVTRVLGKLPPQVRYAPIDFNTQSLDTVLPAAGYDPRRKTLFILEGLVMYVSGTGNDATFAFMRRNSPPGSLVVYDYVLREVIEGKHAGLYASAVGAKSVAAVGEPFVTGWTPPEAAELASRHGFEVIEDLDHRELTRRHLTGSTGQPDGRLPDWQRIISARVR